MVSFALSLLGIFVLSLIADFLAPKFGGVSDKLAAFKLVAYGATASWLAGVFGLIPSLGFFGLLGLYSIYLFYTGAQPLMKVPQDKAAGYVAVTILCAIVLAIIVAPITAAVTVSARGAAGAKGGGGPGSSGGGSCAASEVRAGLRNGSVVAVEASPGAGTTERAATRSSSVSEDAKPPSASASATTASSSTER